MTERKETMKYVYIILATIILTLFAVAAWEKHRTPEVIQAEKLEQKKFMTARLMTAERGDFIQMTDGQTRIVTGRIGYRIIHKSINDSSTIEQTADVLAENVGQLIKPTNQEGWRWAAQDFAREIIEKSPTSN